MEFGSDFHMIEYPVGSGLPYRAFNHYVSGRQPLLDIVRNYGYRRIWVPSYYCGESLAILNRSEVEVCRYHCLPTDDISECCKNLQLEKDDLLLLVNFFGLHDFNDARRYHCDVIEDHTHDLLSPWALNSNARWCFASVRKTLPTADGGILWSPKGEILPVQPEIAVEVSEVMTRRYGAMSAKTSYLKKQSGDKDAFLTDFRATEDHFSAFALSNWSAKTSNIINSIDICAWYSHKKANYDRLLSLLEFHHAVPLIRELGKSTPFSLIILFDNCVLRENARNYLIRNKVYPAILWPDVDASDKDAVDFSNRMLSIHCDARYDENDMLELSTILNRVI